MYSTILRTQIKLQYNIKNRKAENITSQLTTVVHCSIPTLNRLNAIKLQLE